MLPSADTTFNYAALPTDKAASARAAAEQVRTLVSLAVANIIEAGKVCNNQKEALGHGHFKVWVAAELDVSYETVVNWMRVAKEFGDKNVNLTFLKPSTLYALAAPSTPEPVRTQVLERAAAGEKVTAKEIENLKKKLAKAEQVAAKAAESASLMEGRAQVVERELDGANLARLFAEQEQERLAHQLADVHDEIERLKEPGVITIDPVRQFNDNFVSPQEGKTPWVDDDAQSRFLRALWKEASESARKKFMVDEGLLYVAEAAA